MNLPEYKPRIIDSEIEKYLSAFGAVCIEGPKWCGKTWAATNPCKSRILIGDPAGDFQNRRLAQMDPSLILDGDAPRLIDEWQEVPPIWDAVRYKVDQTGKKGQFLLTGSATPNRKGIMHSGAGRIATLRMRTMSLYEAGRSSGMISLEDLCNGTCKAAQTGEVQLRDLAEYIVRGGWPGNLSLSVEQAALLPKQYIKAICEEDIKRISEVPRSLKRINLLLRSLARNECTTASVLTLQKDVSEVDGEKISDDVIPVYLDLFRRLFLIEDQPAFATNVRSSVRIKQSVKRHFCDPSLACALLGLTVDGLINDLNTFGFLFESLCEHDLRIYAESFGAALYHYQDYKGREADAVLEMPDERWIAIEIKLGANQIESAAKSLNTLKQEFEKDPKGKPPAQRIVICGMSNAAYQRDDGVFVVPITALRP